MLPADGGVERTRVIHLTQLIYLRSGREDTFDEFESVAIPLIAKHGGTLLLRLRPGEEAFIEGTVRRPYEIHLVEFPSDQRFQAFMADEERGAVVDKKELSVESSVLIKGSRI